MVIDEDILNQYLTLTVDKENYAINVVHIREVLEFQKVTKLPRTPDYMRGIINLRGKVVPVIDLKLKFGLGEAKKTINTSVIVTELVLGDNQIILGLLTDSVSEVIEIEDNEIESTPYLGTKIESSFIKGLARNKDELLIVLDIEKVLTDSEKEKLAGHLEI